jgi:hypothetical protein
MDKKNNEKQIRQGYECLSLVVSVACSQVEIAATGRSHIQRISTDCGVSLYVIQKPHE